MAEVGPITLAEELLEKAGLHTPPVDPVQLAQSYGLTIRRVTGASWDCALERFDKRIYVNTGPEIPSTRERFCVAHLLGHYFLHEDILCIRDRFEGQKLDIQETAANLFAMNLLVPKYWLRAYSIYENTEQLALRFGVSKKNMEKLLEMHELQT